MRKNTIRHLHTATVQFEDGTWDRFPVSVNYSTYRGRLRATRNTLRQLRVQNPGWRQIDLEPGSMT